MRSNQRSRSSAPIPDILGAVPAKAIDGALIRRARTELTGRDDLSGRGLARRLSDQMDGWFDALARDLPDGWSLMATGGYANGLLCPGSDVDVVLLHPDRAATTDVRAVAEPLWYPMWDAGVKLSPAAHSPKSLLALAATDLVTATTILRVRHLAGASEPIAAMRGAGRDQWRRKAPQWLSELRAVTIERWAKLGDVASLLEPDIKDGRGGLRDYDCIRWALLTDRADVAAALDAPIEDLAAPAEMLLAARCELHRVTGRATNVLLLQDQDAVADAMGFADSDVLMARISEAARAIEWAGERFWRRTERATNGSHRQGQRRPPLVLQPGISVVDDEVEIDVDALVVDQSVVLRVAAEAAHARYPISRRALVTLSAIVTDDNEVWHERTRQAMVSLLGAGSNLIDSVDALERYELFSRMVPEWRHVRHLPQRNAFHLYTVDRHLLQTVANAGEFVRTVSRPDLLLMAALLHDIGKGYSENHIAVGVRLAEQMAPRMGFDAADVDVIRSLVEHHLLLAETATRRDLRDPKTAENVAALVGDPLRLGLLRALTEADSLATGPSAWSAWKAALIDELTAAVGAILAGRPQTIDDDHASERFADLLDAVRVDGQLRTQCERVGDFELWVIATPDQPGLFAKITAAFAMNGVDVIAAEAWTSADGIAIDQFRVSRPVPDERHRSKLEHDLRGVVGGSVDIGSRIAQRIRNYSRAHRRAVAAAPPRLEVLVSNDASASTTMVDVRAPDAIAVLYRLAAALTSRGLDIRSAKVATLGHEVIDVFYVQRPLADGSSAQVDAHEHDALRRDLKAALNDG
jgi:[protein-PII] uridylyltransferase